MRQFLLLSFVLLCAGETTDPILETTEAILETTEAAIADKQTTEAATVDKQTTEAAAVDKKTTPLVTDAPVKAADPAAKENEQAVAVLAGDTPLFRGWYYPKKVHIYSTNSDRYKYSSVNKEGAIGYVVSEANYDEIKKECPDLEKMYIFTLSSGASYIDKDGSPKDEAEVFYCSPKQGYCGANYPLQRIMGKPWQNIYYPTYISAGNDIMRKKGSIYKSKKTVCYIWKAVQSASDDKFKQVRKDVLEDKMTIHGCLVRTNPVLHKYGLDKEDTHKMKTETCKTRIGAIAYVMTEDRQKKATADCPDLVEIQIYQKKGTYASTFISKEAPKDVNNYEKGPEFYCAPKRGYCGADREIVRYKSNVDFFYPLNEWEDINTRTGLYPEFSSAKESVCWAWTNVAFADTSA